MNKSRHTFSILASSRFIVKSAIIIVFAVSILNLTGWMFNITFLKGINLDWTPMKIITAFCFIFSGVAMILIQISSQTRWQKLLTKVLAIIISTIGLFTVAVFINVLATGIELPFVNSPFFNLFFAPHTRMALVTALLFFIIGIVLFLLSRDNLKSANIAHALILSVSIISYMVIMSYILRIDTLHYNQDISVAFNSSIAFLALCFAVLFIRTNTWLMRVFTSQNDGGIMARKLLPVLMMLPVIIGWLRIAGEQRNLYESEVGVLLVAVTYVICFLWLVWLTAKSVNRTDYKRRKLHDKLLENEKLLATTLASIGDAVISTDVKGNITFLNHVAEELTGWTVNDALQKPINEVFKIINEHSRKEVESPVTKVLVNGMKAGLANNTILIKKDGTEIPVDDSGSPVKDKNGNIIGVVLIFRDISERKLMEAEIRSIARFPSENPNPVMRISNNGILLYANEASKPLLKIWNCAVDNFIPEPWLDAICKTKSHTNIEIECDGLFYLFSITPIIESGYINMYGKEITLLKEAEKKLTEAKEIAEEATKAKQQFLSNMSHEIRTPMTAIIGFAKVVLKTDLTDKQREYLTAIKMSGDTLLVLINDILDLAKVDAGKMSFEQTPFNMATSISAMLHLFDIKIHEKNLELVKEYDNNIPQVLVGDPVRLHQIILNLVSNAVKFTAKGKITVSVRFLNEDEEKASIEFSVTDTGIGVEENKIKDIFETFRQASSSTARLYGGTGLGLAIVKQLVELQGGTISVKSKINKGSTFSFKLAFQKTKAEAKSESVTLELGPEIKNIKVLVVEDVVLNQLLMKIILDDFGFERDIADNGKIAIEKLQAQPYDIILMDLQMPEMNGFEATEHIRNKMNSKIPIIALTADVTADDLVKCKAIGMDDHIAKPIDEKLLYSKIVGLVKRNGEIKV